jgi:hypothetical protein
MTYKLMMTLVSEGQEGDCGDDWQYRLEAKVFHGGLRADAVIEVPEHKLMSGEVREPYGAPEPVELFRGECDGPLQVRLLLIATEVDTFVNDVGQASMDVTIECPPEGDRPVVRDVDIAAGVRESPGIRNLNSVLTLRLRFTLTRE